MQASQSWQEVLRERHLGALVLAQEAQAGGVVGVLAHPPQHSLGVSCTHLGGKPAGWEGMQGLQGEQLLEGMRLQPGVSVNCPVMAF